MRILSVAVQTALFISWTGIVINRPGAIFSMVDSNLTVVRRRVVRRTFRSKDRAQMDVFRDRQPLKWFIRLHWMRKEQEIIVREVRVVSHHRWRSTDVVNPERGV